MLTRDGSMRKNSVIDGLPKPPPKREYKMTNHVPRSITGRKIGASQDAKCKLQSIRAAKQTSEKCSQKCLVNIAEKKILFLRFDAWSSNVYNERASWIIEHITNAYVVSDNNNGKDRFDFKLDGQPICNGCYALALGYSKGRLEELKWSTRTTTERYATIHGNSAKQPRVSVQAEATRVAFERYTKECRCVQPDRRSYRKKDNRMVLLVLLSMNTKRQDVIIAVNEEVACLVSGNPLSKSVFYKMWREEFTHVRIPPHSRFSKCEDCWEYRTSLEATKSPSEKHVVQERFNQHQALQRQERQEYRLAKHEAIMFPTQSLCLIVDGMDQNTTMVPKLRQLVKGIESRYVKTHLCGVLLHGVGLYTDVWIDAHHKHNSNQVVTSIMHVLQDVCNRQGNILPPKLRIQADNCRRENKNQYMFALCAPLVAFKYFAEV